MPRGRQRWSKLAEWLRSGQLVRREIWLGRLRNVAGACEGFGCAPKHLIHPYYGPMRDMLYLRSRNSRLASAKPYDKRVMGTRLELAGCECEGVIHGRQACLRRRTDSV
jgi:hypothetical protein